MKTKSSVPVTLAAAATALLLAGTALNIPAQTVTQVDQAAGEDVLVNPFVPGELLLAARKANWEWAVLAADFNASEPSVTLRATQFDLGPYPRRLGYAITAGAIFAVGGIHANGYAWHVQRSLNQGSSWEPLDPGWQWAPGATATASGFAEDAAGNYFVSGWAYDKATSPRQKILWIVRVSADQGTTWSTLKFGSGGMDTAAAIHFVPVPLDQRHLGGVFAVGRIGSAATVMRTRNGGVNWTTVGSWTFRGDAIATSVTSDTQGRIYVGGIAQNSKSGGPYNWFVRRSTDGGDTWADDLGNPLPAGSNNKLNAMAVDGAGNLWAVGAQAYNTSSQAWVMQRWSPATGLWNVTPDYPYGSPGTGPVSGANGASLDPISGNVYVTGTVKDPLGQNYATVWEVSNSN